MTTKATAPASRTRGGSCSRLRARSRSDAATSSAAVSVAGLVSSVSTIAPFAPRGLRPRRCGAARPSTLLPSPLDRPIGQGAKVPTSHGDGPSQSTKETGSVGTLTGDHAPRPPVIGVSHVEFPGGNTSDEWLPDCLDRSHQQLDRFAMFASPVRGGTGRVDRWTSWCVVLRQCSRPSVQRTLVATKTGSKRWSPNSSSRTSASSPHNTPQEAGTPWSASSRARLRTCSEALLPAVMAPRPVGITSVTHVSPPPKVPTQRAIAGTDAAATSVWSTQATSVGRRT